MSEQIVPTERRLLPPLEFNDEDRTLIRNQFCPQATDGEFQTLLKVASLKRLSPFLGQIHFVKRKTQVDGQWVERWATQTGIDGLRAIAERTGLYEGQDEPEFVYGEDKFPVCCKVRVWKKGVARPFIGVAYFEEFAQVTQKGELTRMWREKPHVMLAKCAEAQGLRKAFPDDMAGLFADDEMSDEHASGTPARKVAAETPSAAELLEKQAETIGLLIAHAKTEEEFTAIGLQLDKLPRGSSIRKRYIEHWKTARDVMRAKAEAPQQLALTDAPAPENREPGQEG